MDEFKSDHWVELLAKENKPLHNFIFIGTTLWHLTQPIFALFYVSLILNHVYRYERKQYGLVTFM